MKRNAELQLFFWMAAFVALPTALAYCLPRIFQEWTPDSLAFAPRESIFTLVHFASNAVTTWRLDPLLRWIAASSLPAYFATITGLFTAGTALCYYEAADRESLFFSGFGASVAGAALVLLFGYDTILLSVLLWFPWLLYVVLLFTRRERLSLPGCIFLLFVVIRFAKGANQAALPLGLLALVLAWQWARERQLHVPMMVPAIVLLPLLYVAAVFPAADIPLYPAHARVLDERVPLLAGSDALIGHVPRFDVTPLQVIDQASLREALEPLAFTLLLVTIIVMVDVLRRTSRGERFHGGLYVTGCVSALVCLLDTDAAPPWLSQIMPLYSMTRMFPGLGYLPFIYIGLGLTIFFIGAGLVRSGAADLLVLTLLVLLVPLRLEDWSRRPIALRDAATYPWEELERATLDEEERAYRAKVLLSPSYAIVRELSPRFFEHFRPGPVRFDLVPVSAFQPRGDASKNAQIFNDVLKTSKGRWSSGGGHQTGDEWVSVALDKAQTIAALQLELDGFPTDFPRGVEVLSSPDCDDSHYSPIFSRPDWKGEFRFTKDGYPFRDAEGNVLMVFHSPVQSACLRIRQTAKSDAFEWSITGMKLGIWR